MADTIDNIRNIPRGKHYGVPGNRNGLNAGVVDLKCVINRKCPFVKNWKVNDTWVFNSQSIKNYPEDVFKNLSSIPGTEGVFLNESILYRHNYLAIPDIETKEENENAAAAAEQAQADASVGDGTNQVSEVADSPKLRKITELQNVLETGQPVYRREQRWVIRPSLFDREVHPHDPRKPRIASDEVCKPLPYWEYKYSPLTLDKINTRIPKSDGEKPVGSNIQLMAQVSGVTCGGRGVHFGLEKQTPIFRGEDFFVYFERLALGDDTPQNQENPPEIVHQDYKALDVRYPALEALGEGSIEDAVAYANEGVVNYSADGNEILDNKTYDFTDQPYFIVEFGKNGVLPDADKAAKGSKAILEQRYAIIISKRGPVRLVRLGRRRLADNRKSNLESAILVSQWGDGRIESNDANSGPQRVTGEQLLSADWFRMHVRSHLGQLVIQFFMPNAKTSHWIVSRLDDEYNTNDKLIQVSKPIYTLGNVSMFGGNMRCALGFGPIQYGGDTHDYKFTIPPMTDRQQSELKGRTKTSTTSFAGLNATTTIDDAKLAQLTQNTVDLPADVKHRIAFNVADHPISLEEGKRNNSLKGQMYTQDAYLYLEHENEPGETGGGKAVIPQNWMSIYPPLREHIPDIGGVFELYLSTISAVKVPLGANGGALISNQQRSEFFVIDIRLTAGSHVFSTKGDESLDGDDDLQWDLLGCKTPILTMMRLVADPTGTVRWDALSADVSDYVLEYNDSWSAQDFTRIEHTGNIKLLLNAGLNSEVEQYLLSLAKRNFYIEVWAKYRDPNDDSIFPDVFTGRNNACNYSKIDGYYKLFTGMCFGGTLTGEPGSRVMDCQMHDYTKVLEHMLWFNAPFYDGVRDIDAVLEILRFAGFRETRVDDPAVLLKKSSESSVGGTFYLAVAPDGRPYVTQQYALPNAYSKLTQPFFKAKDGDKFMDGIINMAKKSGKVFFFDSHGVAHYESYFDFSVIGVIAGLDSTLLTGEKPECRTVTDSQGNKQSVQEDTSIQVDPETLALWWYTTDPNRFNGQMIFNSVSAQRVVSDVYNHTQIWSNTPDFELLMFNDTDYDLVDQPERTGFIGYRKTLFQVDGSFGSEEAVRNIMNFYKAMRQPPLVVRFESYGQPVRALDMLLFDGQPMRVMKVDTTISPQENRWWNSFECEWLYPIEFNPEASACDDSSGGVDPAAGNA